MGLKNAFGRWFGKNNSDEEIIHGGDESVNEEIIETEKTADDAEDNEGVVQEDNAQENSVNETAVEPLDDDIVLNDDEEQSDGETESEIESDAEDAETDNDEELTAEVVTEEVTADAIAEKPAAKKGFFARLISGLEKTRKSFNDKIDSVLKMFTKIDDDLFDELEEALILADVGVETSTHIVECLREVVKEKHIKEPSDVKVEIEKIISDILSKNDTSMKLDTTPSVIMVIGVNGVGKTTSIGKMAARYKAQGKKVILGAADTFRAAAIDQLQIWAERSDIEIVRHREGADPAAVVFDTITAAKARGADIIILDTAGRLHNKKNLMDELNKIYRVMERELPDCSKETLLVLDATTGQNAVSQVKLFRESADISGIILTKLDGSARGGIVLAIAHEQGIPVKLVGVGEGIDDLQVFDSEDFAKALFAE